MRLSLWNDMQNFHAHLPWMLARDFNVVTSQDEKSGGNPINIADCSDFNSMITQIGLSDAGYSGSKFT